MMSLHLTDVSTALFAAPSALLERGRDLARRARTTSAPPPPAAAEELAPAEAAEAAEAIEAAREMKLTRTDTETECQLRIEGALDVHNAPELRAIFDSVVSAQPLHVVLDLEGLSMLDSSGVGAIVALFKRVKAAGGSFVVTGVQNQPLAVCKLLKLDRVFGL